MNCDDARALVGAYVDGELDLTNGLQIEEHLQSCADCGRAYRRQQALQEGMRAAALYHPAPPELRKHIRAALRQESKGDARSRWWWPRAFLAAPAALLLVAVLAWSLARGQQAASRPNDLLAQEALASSMRAMIAGPLTEVQSSDHHTVKPWFAGKLDFSPTVQDFGAQGFPLAGGRVDYLGNRPVAALVYRHNQHVINLYTWPASGKTDEPRREATYQGYNVFHWSQGGMEYWAVSDMDAAELRVFAQLVQRSGTAAGATVLPAE